MSKIKAVQVDTNGNFLEDVILNKSQVLLDEQGNPRQDIVYPNIEEYQNVEGIYIADVGEGLNSPKFDFTNFVWIEGLTEAEQLAKAKADKQAELYQAYQTEKWSEITSSLLGADGLAIIFGYTKGNKEDYLSIVSSFAIDANQTSSLIGSKSHGKFSITRDEMITFKNDMKSHEETLYTKIKDKLGKVEVAATVSEVDAIVW